MFRFIRVHHINTQNIQIFPFPLVFSLSFFFKTFSYYRVFSLTKTKPKKRGSWQDSYDRCLYLKAFGSRWTGSARHAPFNQLARGTSRFWKCCAINVQLHNAHVRDAFNWKRLHVHEHITRISNRRLSFVFHPTII